MSKLRITGQIFHDCPGAWTWSAPEDNWPGYITVDADKLEAARAFLTRRFRILGTSASRMEGGVRFKITPRKRAKLSETLPVCAG